MADRSAPVVVLASASASRRTLLENAGVPLAAAEAAALDETEVKDALRAEGASAMQVAETLGELKAAKVSRKHPGALVIGADQMLDCEGAWFDKPADLEQAAGHLRAFSGRRHTLCSSVCIVRDGERIWHHNEPAHLSVRVLTETFIAHYLGAVGERALSSVGAYQLEGPGAQLFTRIEGDYFTILGLPLLPLLEMLRQHGVLEA